VSLSSAAATLVNPYGTTLHVWLWDSLTWARPEITEWLPVRLWSLDYAAFKALLLWCAVTAAASNRPRDPVKLILLALIAVQAFLHVRHVPLFAIAVAFWMPAHADDCVRRILPLLRRPGSPVAAPPSCLWPAALSALSLLFAARTIDHLRTIRVPRDDFPLQAVQFLNRHGLGGRMVTEFNWGQYCLYALYPRVLVSVDGRFDTCYSREAIDMNFDLMLGNAADTRNRSRASGPFDPKKVLAAGTPNLILLNRGREESSRIIEETGDWILLYQDGVAQLWARRGTHGDLPASDRQVSDHLPEGYANYPAVFPEPPGAGPTPTRDLPTGLAAANR
jgi:hypothetical protein